MNKTEKYCRDLMKTQGWDRALIMAKDTVKMLEEMMKKPVDLDKNGKAYRDLDNEAYLLRYWKHIHNRIHKLVKGY
jgi:hypothetical protein